MQMQPTRPKNTFFLLKMFCIAAAGALALIFWGDVISQLAGLLLGAAILAFLLTPLCRLLERRLSRSTAALLALLGALALLGVAAAFLLPALVRQLMQLGDLLPDALERIRALVQALVQSLQKRLPGVALRDLDVSALGANLGEAARSAAQKLPSLADKFYRAFLTVVLSYFLISDRERILLRLELLVPLKWRYLAVRGGNELMRQLRMYLRGQATISLAVGLIASAGMALLGLQGALVLGLVVGICNVIPYFGPFLGGIPAVIAALGIGWQRALMTILALFLVQQIDGVLISPRVMGSITGFSPAVVLLALFSGARIGGIGAMLLTLPVLMACRTVYRVFVQRYEKN